jgi:dipeptidyl aminopeptidase/acylaminoacyl peptidase
MVAAADPRVRAIVVMAGPAQTGRQILEYQNRYSVDSMSRLTGPKRDSLIASIPHALDSLSASNPWMRFFMEHDPLATARTVHTPVLILQGATDRQVSADQANVLAQAFRAGGNTDVTVRVFPETNHLFVADPSGNPTGYGALPSKLIRPEVLGAIADWLTAHF